MSFYYYSHGWNDTVVRCTIVETKYIKTAYNKRSLLRWEYSDTNKKGKENQYLYIYMDIYGRGRGRGRRRGNSLFNIHYLKADLHKNLQ